MGVCCDHQSICQHKYLKAVAQAGKLVLHTSHLPASVPGSLPEKALHTQSWNGPPESRRHTQPLRCGYVLDYGLTWSLATNTHTDTLRPARPAHATLGGYSVHCHVGSHILLL